LTDAGVIEYSYSILRGTDLVMKGKSMKVRAIIAGSASVIGIFGLGYLFASGKPLDHDFVFLALIVGFIACDRSLLPRRFR
jgi:hypothetical protein